MQEVSANPGKNKTWKRAKYLVVHSIVERKEGLVEDCEPEIEFLLDPANFPITGPWVATVHRDTLHLMHEAYTGCEGVA